MYILYNVFCPELVVLYCSLLRHRNARNFFGCWIQSVEAHDFSYRPQRNTVANWMRATHRRRLRGQPGHVPPIIIEKRPCINHFYYLFPQYFGLPTQYFWFWQVYVSGSTRRVGPRFRVLFPREGYCGGPSLTILLLDVIGWSDCRRHWLVRLPTSLVGQIADVIVWSDCWA